MLNGETSTKIKPIAIDSKTNPTTVAFTRYHLPENLEASKPAIKSIRIVDTAQGTAFKPP